MDKRHSKEERLIAIGGTKVDGLPWRLSETAAIAGLEKGSWELHIEAPTLEAIPLVVASRGGRKYLEAAWQGQKSNLLLGLPECAPVGMPRRDANAGS
jgi:hypothetical protein